MSAKDIIETSRGLFVKSESEKPDMIVKRKPGYITIWNVAVKRKTWWGVTWYKNFEVSDSHNEEEAVQSYVKQYIGARYDFTTKETHPEFFV